MARKKQRKRIKKTSIKYIQGLERDHEAVKLRIAGLSLAEISKAIGWKTASAAHKAIARNLLLTVESATSELRALELARIDAIWARTWADFAGRGRKLDRLKIVEALLKISERRGKLSGLDAPIKIEASGSLGVTAAQQKDAEGATTADLVTALLDVVRDDPALKKTISEAMQPLAREVIADASPDKPEEPK